MERIALIIGSVLVVAATAFAQPEVDMTGDQPKPQPPAEPTQPPPVKDPKLAKKWQQAGDKLVQKGDQLAKQGKPDAKTQYDNAVTAYQRAFESSDDVAVLYPLAIALDKAGDFPEALKQLKRVVAASGVKPDLIKKAQAKLDDVETKVGVVTLVIAPEGTQVSIADKPVGEAPLPESLVLLPGTHQVTFTAVGYQTKELDLKVEAGSESERKITLEPVPVVARPPEPEEPVAPPPAPKGPSKLPMYIGGGSAIGLALIATITGLVAVGKHGTFTDASATPAERSDAQSSGRTFAHVTDSCWLGALGAASFTAYWYVYKVNRPQPQASTPTSGIDAKLDIAPWVQPQAGGVVVGGSF